MAYLLSCGCGTTLGRRLIDNGCLAFIGYTEKFAYPTNELDNPFKDTPACGFMEASNEVAISILNGNSPENAWLRSQKKFDEWIKFWLKQEATEDVAQIIGSLIRAKKIQILLTK